MSTLLPPLNSHENYFIGVHALEIQIPPSELLKFNKIQNPIFMIDLHVVACYSAPDPIIQGKLNTLPVLMFKKTLKIDRNPKTLITSLTDKVLSADVVPFQLRDCRWETRHGDGNIPMQFEYLDDEEEVYVKVFEFLCNLAENPDKAKRKVLGVELMIHKLLDVPHDEIWSWIYYYREKKLIPHGQEFTARRYLDAIRRPRSEIELFEERLSLMRYKPASMASLNELESVIYYDRKDYNSGYAKACSICFDRFLNGRSRVSRLPCLHVFHGDCIVRWLRVNHVCPLCRYPLPTAAAAAAQ